MPIQPSPALLALCKEKDLPVVRADRVLRNELQQWQDVDIERVLSRIDAVKKTTTLSGNRDPCGPIFNQYRGLSWKLSSAMWAVRITGILLLLPLQICSAVYLGLWCWKWRAICYEIPKPSLTVVRLFSNISLFVKAPQSLIEQSIRQKKALCVNRLGHFKLIGTTDEDKYAVLSYVWGDIMAWQQPQHWGSVDLAVRKKGLSLEHLERLFDLCCETAARPIVDVEQQSFVQRKYDYDWMWLDVVAMPEILEDMNSEEQKQVENLRVGVINNLPTIYQNADRVTVADGVVRRLRSGSMIDCAVVLCFGFWIERLWTYVESRLAKKVLVRTADYAFDLDDIINCMTRMFNNDQHRYWGILVELSCLRPTPENGERLAFESVAQQERWREGGTVHILEDVLRATAYRFTNVRVDHARILFPLTDSLWEAGWNVEDAFNHLLTVYPEYHEYISKYYSYREHAIKRQGCVRGKIWRNDVVESGLAEAY